MRLEISRSVEKKLREKHSVTEKEVVECFQNVDGCFLEDDREAHKTEPPTKWFIAKTNKERILKIIFMFDPASKVFTLKSAYEPEDEAIKIYKKHAY